MHMKCIDSHQHLWDLANHSYPWLAKTSEQPSAIVDLSRLRRNYLVADYQSDIANHDIVKAVHIDARYDENNPAGETAWLQSVADEPGSGGIPHGIVAYANLADENVEALLAAHAKHANLRGIRHILNRNPNIADRDYLADVGWCENFGLLKKFGLSFDLQIYFPQMSAAARLARRYPETQIILNHAGMPHVPGLEGFAGWQKGMRELAACGNIAAKISGLAMTSHDWTTESIRPHVLETIEIFGVDRCMFGSNFPVDGLYSTFDRLWSAFKTLTRGFSECEREALFHDNAERFYRL